MILGIIGVMLCFIGSLGLAWAFCFAKNIYAKLYDKHHITRYIRLRKQDHNYEKSPINYEEVVVTVSWILLSLGFLLQILEFFFKINFTFYS